MEADLLCGLAHADNAVHAKLKPDGEQARQGLVDVVVALLHSHAIVPDDVLDIVDEWLILANLNPAGHKRASSKALNDRLPLFDSDNAKCSQN